MGPGLSRRGGQTEQSLLKSLLSHHRPVGVGREYVDNSAAGEGAPRAQCTVTSSPVYEQPLLSTQCPLSNWLQGPTLTRSQEARNLGDVPP